MMNPAAGQMTAAVTNLTGIEKRTACHPDVGCTCVWCPAPLLLLALASVFGFAGGDT